MSNANEVATYHPDVFSLKKHVAELFTPNFIESYELSGLHKKIADVTAISKTNFNRTPIISFCSEKGGSGKTTTALCVMQAVANLGFKVLLIDVDPTRGSSAVVNSRKALINAEIASAEEQGIPIENVLEYKFKLEPVIDALTVLPENFNASWVLEIAEKKEYDLIVLDTPGIKGAEAANFDPRLITKTGNPHVTSSYVSNLTIVPTATSNIDLVKMIAFTQPLMAFLGALNYSKQNIVNNKYRVLANRVEKQGSGLKELAQAKEEVLFNWFINSIRRSEKIAANTSTKHTGTVFSNNTAKQINITFLDIVDEIYNDIAESVEK